jgi:predicted amidophosphoribosyltransferase
MAIIVFCPVCGKENENTVTVCIHCGVDFSTLSDTKGGYILVGILMTVIALIWLFILFLGKQFSILAGLLLILGLGMILYGIFLAPHSINCPKCGGHMSPDFTYCRQCGTLMKTESSK